MNTTDVLVSPGNPNNLPSHLSERSFRVYESAIAEAVRAFPNETRFAASRFTARGGTPLSINTAVARFRDAVVSLKRFKWETEVDCAKLWSITGEFVITLDPNGYEIWFRNKQRKGRPAEYKQDRPRAVNTTPTGATTNPKWSDWSIEELRAVALLIHHARVEGPFILSGRAEEQVVLELESTLNVGITYSDERDETIVM